MTTTTAFNVDRINKQLSEITFEKQWLGYVDYLCWRGFNLGLKPVSFNAYLNTNGGLLPDEIIAIYKQTGNFFY